MMSNLSTIDRMYLEKLFGMDSGYVLDFSNRTMGEFFAVNLNIDIYEDRYNYDSGSKANRVRGLWNEDDDYLVGQSILELIDYIEFKISLEDFHEGDFSPNLIEKCKQIGRKLLGINLITQEIDAEPLVLETFLKEDFRDITAAIANLESDIKAVIQQRIIEIESTLTIAPLASIFLIGSTLEGILLDIAKRNAAAFVQADAAPAQSGTTLPLPLWKLSDLINVTFELGYLSEDVKKFSHTVREFRNYIHPRAQAKATFNPTSDTAKICFQVLKAALTEINAKVTAGDVSAL
ncbi:MAG: hypothetical protein HKL80_01800 [Acidimicrobiales bacterium]|nr:hypothetical protein [Acidimicrobiales bacterium]